MDETPTDYPSYIDSKPDKTESEKAVELILNYSTMLAHDLSQPLTFLLTSLEMAHLGKGLTAEECQFLFNEALNMRYQIQQFRDSLRQFE